MKRLAIETATYACSVALDIDGEVRQRFALAPRRHGELILPWTDELLAEAQCSRQQLDGVALSRGPGSFTSMRLGMSAAVAIAFALDIPVYPVSTLAALAWAGYKKHGHRRIFAALDARMQALYTAAYELQDSQLHATQDEQLIALADIGAPATDTGYFGVGNGFALEEGRLPRLLEGYVNGVDADCWPDAAAVVALSHGTTGIAAEAFQPVYLRDEVAHPAANRHVSC